MQRGKTPGKRFLMEKKKAGFMCSKDGKKMPIFNNYFQIDLSLEKTEDHIIRNLELKQKVQRIFLNSLADSHTKF